MTLDVDPKDLDAIIMGTVSADYPFPSSACVLEDMLGARNAFSFDVGAACAGFLNALAVADLFVRSGKDNKALVVGSDALSRMLNWQGSWHLHSVWRRRRRGGAGRVRKRFRCLEHQAAHRRFLR